MKDNALLNNSFFLIIYILVFSALLTCIAAPPVNILLNNTFDEDFALSRVMSRAFMGFTFILLLIYRKRLKSDVGQSLNYTSHPWVKQISWGFLIGFGTLLLLSVVFWIMGAIEPDISFSPAKHARKLLKYLGVAFAVALGEEIFFRGIVFQSLRADIKAFFALITMAALFAFVHFLHPEGSVDMGRFDFLAGFKTAPRFLDKLGSTESFMIAIGLFLMGIAMGVAYLSTQSLFLPIGIHAGWIFFNKINSRFFTDVDNAGLLFGEPGKKSYLFGTDSLIAWIMMAVLTALLIAFGSKFRGKKA